MAASMIQTKYHLDEARASITVAIDHLHKAEAAEVDPEVAAPVYANARSTLQYVEMLCVARGVAGGPDLDREKAAIDATREAGA